MKPVDGETIDKVFENFQKELKKTTFEKLEPEKYVFSVDGCAFSNPCHTLLDPKDVTCTYALIVMSLFQAKTGKKVKPTLSEFSPEGAKTIIEPL